jgi:hypothetical protein
MAAHTDHHGFMSLGTKLQNSAIIAFVNLAMAIAAFVSFVYPRFSNLGFKLVPVILFVLLATLCLCVRDFLRRRIPQAVLALFHCLPVLFLFSQLMQWEGPLYIPVRSRRL